MRDRIVKRAVYLFLALCLLALPCTVPARAEEAAFHGFAAPEGTQGLLVEGLSETWESIEAVPGEGGELLLPGAGALRVTLPESEEGRQYLLRLAAEDGTLLYVGQAAGGGEVSFTVAFVLPETEADLTLFLTSDAPELAPLHFPLRFTPAPVPPPAPPHAELSRQSLKVDGGFVKCSMYNIDGYNYFKLRDLAFLLRGTGSAFDVGWDAVRKTVTITTGAEYSGSETRLLLEQDASATAQRATHTIVINGVEDSALTAYNIGGYNYFRLRELGNALGFDVDYDAEIAAALVQSRAPRYLLRSVTETAPGADGGTYTATETREYSDGGLLLARTRVSDQGEEREVFSYDDAGRLLTSVLTAPDGQRTTDYLYDDRGNLLSERVSGDGEPMLTEYAYNAQGYVSEKRFAWGEDETRTVYEYDARCNLLSAQSTDRDGARWGSVYTYDAVGNCLSEVYQSASGFRSERDTRYDAAGRILSETERMDLDGETSETTVTNTYSASGQLLRTETREQSPTGGERVTVTDYAYDAAGGLRTETRTDPDGSITVRTVYLDEAGRPLRLEEGGSTREYVYDAGGRCVRILDDGKVTGAWEYVAREA